MYVSEEQEASNSYTPSSSEASVHSSIRVHNT